MASLSNEHNYAVLLAVKEAKETERLHCSGVMKLDSTNEVERSRLDNDSINQLTHGSIVSNHAKSEHIYLLCTKLFLFFFSQIVGDRFVAA